MGRLSRTGMLDTPTKTRLETAVRPTPTARGPGKRAEILLDRQVALLIKNNTVERAISVSTGKPSFHQYEVVPTYAASHGCVRQRSTVARWTYGFAYVGMPVKVLANS